MAVIKAIEMSNSTLKQERFNLNDIAAEGKRIVEDAKLKCHQMLTDAKEKIRNDRAEAKEAGHKEGYDVGFAEGQRLGHAESLEQARVDFAQQAKETIETLSNSLGEFDRVKHELLWKAEQGVVSLAIAIAEKVIKKASSADEGITVKNVKAALELINKITDVSIHVNSRDLDALKRLADSHDKTLGQFTSISIESDESIEPGGCRVFTANGEIDAQLETQVQLIADELVMAGFSLDGQLNNNDRT